MLCCTRICKAANCSQLGFGGNRILLVGDRFIAGECAKRLIVLKRVSVETILLVRDRLIAGENAKLLIAFKRVLVETESHWLETCLLQGNVQSRLPFSFRFRWKQNLTGWRQVYCTRICQADSGSQTVFGGNRILLV